MEFKNCIKAYIQKTVSVMKIIDMIGFSLGAEKKYWSGDKQEFNIEKEINNDNNFYITSLNNVSDCSLDIYIDKNGNSYIALMDPSSLVHAFKIQDEPFSPILNGNALSITFMDIDSLSLALAITLVNHMGGCVTIGDEKVHSCTNKDCKLPLLSKEDMEKSINEPIIQAKISNMRHYKLIEKLRLMKVIPIDFIEKLHQVNPELDSSKEAKKRIKIFKDYVQDSKVIKNKISVKVG